MRVSSLRSIVVGAALCTGAGLLTAPATAVAAPLSSGAVSANAFAALPGSVRPATDALVGAFTSPKMTITVALAPRNASQLPGLLTALTNPKSNSYGHWLKKGQFAAYFAPSAAQTAAVTAYLRANGLVVGQSSSPFFVRASGTSSAVSAAFKTSLRAYRNARGVTYFSNASAVQLPASLAADVLAVVGLTNTVRSQPQYKAALTRNTATKTPSSCVQSSYPTQAELFNAVNNGIFFPYYYGGGPGCNGLTPSQINSIYGAPNYGSRGKGAGVNLAVFELSAYVRSDIGVWEHQFYGSHYKAPGLVDINVDGGPLNPNFCPPFDFCVYGYSGNVEVNADIEMSLAIAPAVSNVLVYNAPNDYTGQTELDEYSQIANDDIADTTSSSWGTCENDVTPLYVRTENLVFEQMALQGQSIFSSSGDTGAFGCIRADTTTVVGAGDPSSQPWVTSVGGTSFETFNPGSTTNPAYPKGIETVWNTADLCNDSPDEGGHPGTFWCAETGAGGGGNSQYWTRPFFQFGPGIANPYTQQCALAAPAAPCREVPDVSADADAYTGYAEYCTDPKGTAGVITAGECNLFSSTDAPGWFGIGGTSLSSPLWSAIIADRDGFQGTRSGSASTLLYLLYNTSPSGFFNDITGIGQTTNNNGLFPVVPGYDLGTGIGTPKMTPIITGVPST